MDRLAKKLKWLKFRLLLKSYGKMERDSFAHAKKVFLGEFDKKFPGWTAGEHQIRKRALRYALVFALIFLIINGSTIVFADQADVNADSPLYVFKRAGENIQLRLASPEQEPVLRYKFAKRRLTEINSISDNDADKDDRVQKLSDDFHAQLNNALDRLDDQTFSSSKNKVATLCASASEIIDEYDKMRPEAPENLSMYKKHCAKNQSGALKEADFKTADNPRSDANGKKSESDQESYSLKHISEMKIKNTDSSEKTPGNRMDPESD